MEKDRADKMLVLLGLTQTRSKAAGLISRGEVFYGNELVKKPSQIVGTEGLRITSEEVYVGRGAYKLVEATERFNISFTDKIVADVGASTGGFTQVSLINGARKVYAIDVGHDQLDPLLRDDERVINLEGTNIREMEQLGELVDMVVVDLSFISLDLVFEDICKLLKENGEGIFLVKPQFELDKKSLGKKGIVKDPQKQLEVLERIFDLMKPQDVCISPIKGKEGNREFLFYFIKGRDNSIFKKSDLKKLVMEKL